MGLLGLEEGVLHDGVDEIAHAVAGGASGGEDVVEGATVREADGCAGGIDEQLLGEIAGDGGLFAGEQELLEVADVLEGGAVGEGASGIDGEGVVEGEALAGEADAGFGLGFVSSGPVALAPAAHDVETFEGEAGGIDFAVAGGAGGVGTVFVELLTDGDGAADVGFDGRDAGGRGGFKAEDAFHDPDAAEDG